MCGIGTYTVSVSRVILTDLDAINVQNLVSHLERVALHTDHSLNVVLDRVMRRIEDNYITANGLLPSWNPRSEKGYFSPINRFVDKEEISHKESSLHR